MRRKIWKIKETDPGVNQLAQSNNLHPFLVQVLFNRGLKPEEFVSFLNPVWEGLHSPYLLPDMEIAKARVYQAVQRKEKVLVYGDYDVDGITSLAIFNEFACDFPGVFSFYIPHRIKEGYGLNSEAVRQAKKEKVSLIIAFDCGTASSEEINLAKSFGIDVIVIDHHYPGKVSAAPLALINPKRKGAAYPFPDLSAGALSFKFLQVLKGSACRQALDLAALSLVCDVVPLKGENRILLKAGLEALRVSPRPAIKALCAAGSINQKNIDTFHIGFILGPRINASGRVSHPQDALKLFLTQDAVQAASFADKLSAYNSQRRGIEAKILKEAEEKIQDNLNRDKAIVVCGENWHQGVLGIVASRLAEKYYRPSFVISFTEGLGKGSGRSIHSVHLMELLDKCSQELILYGGHEKAAGVHIQKEKLEVFKDKINSLIEENSRPEDFVPVLNIDALLKFSDIDMGLVEQLEKLKPYGEANSEAMFACFNVFKKSPLKKINSGFSLWLSDGLGAYEAVIYDKDILEVINYCERVDIAFSLQADTYHNLPKLAVRGCRLA